MTLSSTVTKSSYTSSSSSPFPTGFKFLLNTDVKVIFRDALGVETTLTEGSHYTLTGAGNDAGGTVTITDSNYEPDEAGETLTIKRAAPETQGTDLPLGGAFPSASVEESLDRLTMLVYQHSEEIARGVLLAETSSAGPITLPDPAADTLVGWNAGGTDLENKSSPSDAISSSTLGMIAQTTAGTFVARTITGTANEISVADGDGVAGEPTLSFPATLDFSGKTITDLGTVATADIDGGSVDGTIIGANTAAALTCTTFTSTGIDDNATSEQMQIGDSAVSIAPNTMIGSGSIAPDGTLHVHTASAGTVTAATNADDLVVENDAGGGISILTPNNVTGHIMFGDPDDNDVGRIAYFHSDNSLRFDTNASSSLIIDSTGGVGIGAAASGAKLYVTENATNLGAIRGYNTSASFTSHTLQLYTDTVAGTGFNFVQCASDVAGTVDNEYLLRGDGNAFADGSWSGCGADYAEYFESADGSRLDIGRTVVLEGNRVRYSTPFDHPKDIIGVVRPKAMSGRGPLVRGNSAWNMWAKKYLTDDYGAYIMEDYFVYEWRETVPEQDDGIKPGEAIHSYAEDNIPNGITVPRDAKKTLMKRRKLNPAWDQNAVYISREDRDEWALIGLLGQMPITKSEKLGLNWVKLMEISTTVDEYLVR